MAKIHIDRLKKKYKNIKGDTYQEIVSKIIDQNTTNINNKISRLNKAEWEKGLKKITTKEKRFVLPDITDVLPARTIQARKTAEKGKLITQTLHDRLTKNLRNAITDFSIRTGQPAFIKRRGVTAGRINPDLIKEFEKNITQTFKTYTKRDKILGVPKNIHSIAVTEVRSSISEIKDKYTEKIIEKNPDVQAQKKWIHNKSLSHEPRKGHMQINGQTVKYNELFKVPRYKIIKGKKTLVGHTMMKHPHDPNAPLDQIVSCNCDTDIIISRKRK